MQILYINSNAIPARQLHADFLSYRGFVWDLTHCQSRSEALQYLESGQYDVILYEAGDELQVASDDLEILVANFAPVPVLAIVRDASAEEELRLFDVGVHDTISERYIDGAFIMRRMRMAMARTSCRAVDKHPAIENSFSAQGAFVSGQPLRLLIVESEKTFHDLGSELTNLAGQVEIESTDSLQTAEIILSERISEFSGVLVEQSAVENQELERLKKLRSQILQIPFVMMILDRSDFTAVSCIEQGFSDCIVATYGTTKEVLLSVRKSLARLARLSRIAAMGDSGDDGNDGQLPASDRRSTTRSGSNRRRNSRYEIERQVVAYAIQPDGSPDHDNIYNASSLDFSVGGIGFQIPLLDRLPGRNWLIGVLPFDPQHESEQVIRYSNVILRHIKYESDGIKIGSMFKSKDELFNPRSLAPTIDSNTNRVKYGLAREILDQWVELDVLSKRITQRAKACPDCHAVVSVGDGCCQCGSAAIDFRVLIHHFACAYVDDAAQFQTDGGISCPKCLSSGLVVGADFELIKSRYECTKCAYEGSETESVGACFHCLLRFPLRLAREVEIYRYDVQRLDILDILDSAKRLGAVASAPVSV